jgi:hypothetical protein
MAAGIPGARFVALPGRNHLFLETEPAFVQFRSTPGRSSQPIVSGSAVERVSSLLSRGGEWIKQRHTFF